MRNPKFLLHLQILIICSLILFSALRTRAQAIEPNPDSPTPVLISEGDSTRALATAPGKVSTASGDSAQIKSPAFPLYSKVVIYVANLDLMPGEDATAFRLNVEDARGRNYRFPVLNLQPLKERPQIFALTIELRDELGFYEPPTANGDVAIRVVWRGLQSNRLRLGLGKTGGFLRDEPNRTAVPDYVGDRYSGDRTRFLEQATFGSTDALDERVRRIGLRVWLEEQFQASSPTVPYPEIPLMQSSEPLECNGSENPNTFPPDPPDIYPQCRRDRYTMYPAQTWFFKEAFYGNAQLRHRTAWALSQMWVISGNKTQQASHFLAYHKVLNRNAFGNYRTLMQEMTLNPGMGDYLDMARNVKNNVNENYAREILQLFTIGLFKLNPNGTLQINAENEPIATFDQNTVDNFAKVFTGWSFCETLGATCPTKTFAASNYKDPLLLDQNKHDATAKTLLDYPNAVNKNIAANTNGTVELNQALDNIYNHPNVAPYVSRFLIQHLVTSDPTPAYVGRIAAVFNANRTSATQLKEVIKAILLDPEARGNVKTDPNYGKLREPVLLATNLLRQFKVQSADGAAQSDGYVAQIIAPMGQNIFYSPAVFNYYPPDYIVPGPGLNGPEFAILTTGTAIARTNFINTVVFNRVYTGANSTTGTSINLTEMQALAAADATGNQLLDALNAKLLHGTMTEQSRNSVKAALAVIPASESLLRAQTAIYLIAASSRFQVQR